MELYCILWKRFYLLRRRNGSRGATPCYLRNGIEFTERIILNWPFLKYAEYLSIIVPALECCLSNLWSEPWTIKNNIRCLMVSVSPKAVCTQLPDHTGRFSKWLENYITIPTRSFIHWRAKFILIGGYGVHKRIWTFFKYIYLGFGPILNVSPIRKTRYISC